MIYEAIAIGTGPSFRPWVDAGGLPNVPMYASGLATHFLKVDVYLYSDGDHTADLPTDGTTIIAASRVWREGMEKYDESFPHAAGAGGMAITEACKKYKRIGLIGFDGGMQGPYDEYLRDLLMWWIARGRTFVSLMPVCAFDDLLEKP